MKQNKLKSAYDTLDELSRAVAIIVNNEPTFSVTLNSSATSTVVPCDLCGADSVVVYMPTTLDAATELATMYVSSLGDKTFTITHSNLGNTNRIFKYTIYG